MESTASEMEMQEIEPDLTPESAEHAIPQSAESRVLPSSQYRLFDRIVEHNLKYLRVVCKLGLLPFEVDLENQQVSPTKSTIRWLFFYFITFACFVKGLFVVVTLVASLLNPDWFQKLSFPFHLVFALIASTTEIGLFLRPKLLCLSTVLLTEALAQRQRVKLFSRQQLILASLPVGLTSIAAPLSFVLPFTTVSCQFGTLLQAVSTEWNSEISPGTYWFLRVAAYALDAFPFYWLSVGAVYAVISIVLILEVLYFWCDDLRVKANRFNLADCYGELVDIQIMIGFFNQIYAHVVFMQKVFGFSVGISALVTVFWYGFDSFFIGVINLYMGIVTVMLYPLMYEKPALISGRMEIAKKSLQMAAADLEDEKERAFWQRKVKAIRIVFVTCGPRPIERESLLLFCDFFISNFISVLLTA